MSIINNLPIDFTEEFIKIVIDILNNKKRKDEFIKGIPKPALLSKGQIINKLIDYYERENFVLVLGAGVSMEFGLPNWDTLLQKLMITTIEKEEKVSMVLSKLFTNIFSPSPLIAGRYLQKYYEEKKQSFEEAVRKVLYEEIIIDKKSMLMEEIVNFCVAPGNSPNLDCIINYNFDDILEQRLSKVGVQVPHKPIFGIGINPDGNLPIYHVHGFLPQNNYTLSDQNQITFGESIYHKQYSDIYSWNNMVQINKFRDSNCLFIGSSLTDPNIRRLLDIAKKQKGEKDCNHFIFKRKYKPENIKPKLQDLLKNNNNLLTEKTLAELNIDETVNFLINIVERFEESDTLSFGVRSIWINEWEEIPEMLKDVRSRRKK